MNKNKKGFTLVELLAVIVILAVVILIAVTAVIPRMNNAKKKAFIDEALIYMNSISDAAVVNEGTECFNISDLGEYVEQTKDGYSGAIYVNEDGNVTINITNGTYYLVTNRVPLENDIVETQPTNFISSCSDTSKTYNITYELNGGTLATANPSTYTPNTQTITLNNPTKSGYEFIGWSTKNMASTDVNDYTNGVYSNYPIKLESGKTYTFTARLRGELKSNSYYNYCIVKSGDVYGDFQGLSCIFNAGSGVPSSTPYKYNVDSSWTSPKLVSYNNNNKNRLEEVFKNYDIQLEEGSSATDYQEYMAPTTNAKIYRGSTGNKKFIANFTNIFKITLDAQGATSAGTLYAYYQYNTTATIDGTLCYYYLDKELTTCVTNGYYITRPTKTGYTFKGYYTEPNGAGTQYVTASGGFTNNIYRTLGDRTLYAYWVAS